MKFLVMAILVWVAVAETKWDGLKVTWGTNPLKFFKAQPRKASDAENAGFKRITNKCGESAYNGFAYVKDGDYGLTLLYDINGFIAGMQVGITKDQAKKTGYPSSKIQPPFLHITDDQGEERYALTVYFSDPTHICETERTQSEFDRDGTGNSLAIQTGNDPSKLTFIPNQEDQLKSPWVEGKCFWSMGKHYWYNISEGMDCDAFFPVFLLYNGGELNALGWSLVGDFPSTHFEHPGFNVFGAFMKSVPKCLQSAGTISTMHIYLTNNPIGDHC